MEAKTEPITILLDTNVWRYIADHSDAFELFIKSRRANAIIQVAPSVVHETLRMSDTDRRDKICLLLAYSKWCRLMPEAYSECEELMAEMKRLLPSWFAPSPDLTMYKRNEYDWRRQKKGFWTRIHVEPHNMARWTWTPDVNQARRQAEAQRAATRENSFKQKSLASIVEPVPLWPRAVEGWRKSGFDWTALALNTRGPYRDWLEPFLLQHSWNPLDWAKFWYADVQVENLPRFWVRWAFEYLQQFYKLTDGAPCDSQLSAYFLESHFFVSADKIFIAMVDHVRKQTKLPISKPIRVAGGKQGVDELFSWLGNLNCVPSSKELLS